MIGGLGGPELIIVLVILVLLFGAKKIPELAKGLGSGMREFRKSSSGKYEVEDENKKEEELSSADKEVQKDAEVKADKEGEDISNGDATDDATAKAEREEQRQS
ncbi:MAG: twin-arginine translocase TatA/TatE family subunit [Rubrobacteraceae bacterium]